MEEFFTMKGYRMQNEPELTDAMEDYLEMIVRTERKGERIRVSRLSKELHVTPASVSKMLRHLETTGYLDVERYRGIALTDKGRATGEYLLYRHAVILDFLCTLNRTVSALEETEKIEHFLGRDTVENLARLTARMKETGLP